MRLEKTMGVALAALLAGCWVDNTGYRQKPADLTATVDLRWPPDLVPCAAQVPPAGGGAGMGRPEVLVPAGMGQIGGTAYPVPAFYLDVYLVTVSAYRDCYGSGAGPCTKPDTSSSYCNWSASAMGKEDHPINCINWMQADAFCKWANRRLPTEGELAYAGWGKQGAISAYPWGSDAPQTGAGAQLCWNQYSNDDMQRPLGTCPVGSFPITLLGGRTCPGAADLAGNVWEWTGTEYKGTYNSTETKCSMTSSSCSIRGGSWFYNATSDFGAAFRIDFTPGNADDVIGVRCARTP